MLAKFLFAAVSRNSQFCTAKFFASVNVKHDAIVRKLATKIQFCILTSSADTGMVVVLAVSSVNVGLELPPPRPITATPFTSSDNAVAVEIVSA
jgi:hypothetical protein